MCASESVTALFCCQVAETHLFWSGTCSWYQALSSRTAVTDMFDMPGKQASTVCATNIVA